MQFDYQAVVSFGGDLQAVVTCDKRFLNLTEQDLDELSTLLASRLDPEVCEAYFRQLNRYVNAVYTLVPDEPGDDAGILTLKLDGGVIDAVYGAAVFAPTEEDQQNGATIAIKFGELVTNLTDEQLKEYKALWNVREEKAESGETYPRVTLRLTVEGEKYTFPAIHAGNPDPTVEELQDAIADNGSPVHHLRGVKAGGSGSGKLTMMRDLVEGEVLRVTGFRESPDNFYTPYLIELADGRTLVPNKPLCQEIEGFMTAAVTAASNHDDAVAKAQGFVAGRVIEITSVNVRGDKTYVKHRSYFPASTPESSPKPKPTNKQTEQAKADVNPEEIPF